MLVACLVVLTVLGLALRMVGTNWDDDEHLHPDERYMSSVADNIDWPGGVGGYFDVETSRLSPYNSEQGRDYVYGFMPLLATKLVATAVGQEGYGTLNLVGRRLGALLDTASIILVFLVTRLLLEGQGRRRADIGALGGAGLYAFAVTAIQHAHFFTTDVWLTFFGLLTVYLALLSVRHRGPGRASWLVPALGASSALTVACKVSGALVLIPVLIALMARAVLVRSGAGTRAASLRLAADAGLALLAAYVTFRIVSPYTFAHSSWLDLSINDAFRLGARGTGAARRRSGGFPALLPVAALTAGLEPAREPRPVATRDPVRACGRRRVAVLLVANRASGDHVGPERTVARRGRRDRACGPSHDRLLRRRSIPVLRDAVRAQRPLPRADRAAPRRLGGLRHQRSRRTLPRGWGSRLGIAVVAATGLYATAFDRIYTRPNTRVAASDWIESHDRRRLDDRERALGRSAAHRCALGRDDGPGSRHRRLRRIAPLVFDPDDAAKLRKLYDDLRVSDYYILSSPRAWNTIGRLPRAVSRSWRASTTSCSPAGWDSRPSSRSQPARACSGSRSTIFAPRRPSGSTTIRRFASSIATGRSAGIGSGRRSARIPRRRTAPDPPRVDSLSPAAESTKRPKSCPAMSPLTSDVATVRISAVRRRRLAGLTEEDEERVGGWVVGPGAR